MADLEVYPEGKAHFGGREYRVALGRAGVTTDKREGDGASPAGAYKMLKVYYRADKMSEPKTSIPVEVITRDLGWADDPADPEYYNQPVKLPYAFSHEQMWRSDDDWYDIVVDLDYNRAPSVPGRGSAIFAHLAKDADNTMPTAGCVAFFKDDLLAILAEADVGTMVKIHSTG